MIVMGYDYDIDDVKRMLERYHTLWGDGRGSYSVNSYTYKEEGRVAGGRLPTYPKNALMDKIVIDEAMRYLRPVHFQALFFTYMKRLNQSQVAQILGVDQSTVSRRVSRGICELTHILNCNYQRLCN